MKCKKLLVVTFMALTASAAYRITRIKAVALKALENDGKELAIIDPREEGTYGQGHLLHAANIPLSKLELNIAALVPRRSTRVVLADGGEGTAARAAARLKELG